MFMPKRTATMTAPVLSDEAAFMIQIMLEDIGLWFNAVYGHQIRRCYAPSTGVPGEPLDDIDDDAF
jgi:hypothetical protein